MATSASDASAAAKRYHAALATSASDASAAAKRHRVALATAASNASAALDAEKSKSAAALVALDAEKWKVAEAAERTRAAVALLKIATNELSVAKTASSALSCLTNAMNDDGPSDAIQDFVHDVVVMCTEPGTDEFVLKWKRADGAQSCSTRYTRLKRRSLLKTDASDSSRKRWVSTKARELIDLVGSVSKEHFGSILKMIGHRSGFIVVDHGELMLSVAQCVAI